MPKGCVHFHRDILAPCDTFAAAHFRMAPGDVAMTSAPIAFTFGLGATLMFPLRFGAAAATIEQPSPPAMLEAIAQFGVTHLATAPTAYKAMLSQPGLDDALKSLTTCLSAGEHLPEAVWHAWKERTGIAIVDGIGSTEMMHIFISESGDEHPPRLHRPRRARLRSDRARRGRPADGRRHRPSRGQRPDRLPLSR